MRDFINPDSPIYIFGEKVFDIIAVSILWALCCIPIITIIPATGALYYVTVKLIRKNNGSLLSNFFSSFRDSMRVGIPLTSIVLVYATVVVAAIWKLNDLIETDSLGITGDYLSYAVKALLIPLLLVLPYLAPTISRFSMGIGGILKLCMIISFRFFWRTLFLLIIMSGAAVLLLFIPQSIIALPCLCALLCSFLIEPVLRNYMPKPDPDDPIPWYWE